MLNFADFLLQVAIGGKHVEAAIQIVIEEEDAKLQQQTAGGADTFRDRFVGEDEGVVLRNVERGHFVCEITDGDAERAVIAITCRINAHRAASVAIGIESDAGDCANFLEGPVALIMEDEILDGVVRDNQIDPTIVIDVYGRYAQCFRRRYAGGRIFDL